MLRRSCRRWLDTQPRTAPVPVFPTKQGSAGCDPTPATAAVTRPPDCVVLVEAASAKIPPSVMQKATCFRPAILMLRPLGWPSTLATPPPNCDLDVHVDVEGSCLRPPRSLAVPPSRWRDQGCTTPTSGDIFLAGCLMEKDATFSHPPIQRHENTTLLIPLANHDSFDEHPGPFNGSVHRQVKLFGVHFTSVQKHTCSLAVLPNRLSDCVTSPTSGNIPFPRECLCFKEKDHHLPPAKDTIFSHPSDQRRKNNTSHMIPSANVDIFDENQGPFNIIVDSQMKQFAVLGMDLISSQEPSAPSLKCTCSTDPSHNILSGHFYAEDRASMLSSEVGADQTQIDGSVRQKMVQNLGNKRIPYCIPRRCFSTGPDEYKIPLSPPMPPPDNLLEVVWPFTKSDTKPFYIGAVPADDFIHAMEVDNAFVRGVLGSSALEHMYHTKVKPALLPRGMVLPYQLNDRRTRLIHNRFKRITKQYPIYMTSLDIMIDLITTEISKWIPLLDDLSKKHIYVIEDWTQRFYTSSGYTIQDYGLRVGPNSGKEYHRGECDGSFNQLTNLAKISAMIWLDDQVPRAAVCYGIPCRSSLHAEALAMALLLKMGIPYKKLQVVADCEAVINAIKGWKLPTPSDPNYEDFMQLRYLRTKYNELIPRLETREKLSFADCLLKEKTQPEYKPRYVKCLLERWAPALRGAPVFMIGGRATPAIKKLASNRFILEEFQSRCYCEVEKDSDKLSALFHIISSLGANDINLIVSDLGSRPELEQQFIQMFGHCDISKKIGRRYFLEVPRSALYSYIKPTIPLFVVFDVADASFILQDSEDAFVVVLSTPNERVLMTELNIEMFSPVSYVSFHRHTNAD
uniref:RNase H type-1 domain-containing protein n=1 Tax=Hordeum vulgare subsp. vulgare TaxID=112509 RepID=A0A8I7B256_HORVV